MSNKNVYNMSAGDYRKSLIAEQERKEMQAKSNAKKDQQCKIDEHVAYEEMQNRRDKAARGLQEFANFKRDVRKSLLSECIMTLYNGGIGQRMEYANEEAIKRGLVNKFIEENGAENIIRKFSTRSYILSEFARNINKYSKLICEKAKADGNTTVDTGILADFKDALTSEDLEDLCLAIKMRVSNALSEFNANNMQEKQEIKDVVRIAQDKIDTARTSALKESYEKDCKRRVSDIRSRGKNVFGAMVFNIAESAIKNEKLSKAFTESNELDVASIVERVEILYTFLETLNSAMIENIDEEYIKKTLKGLKA